MLKVDVFFRSPLVDSEKEKVQTPQDRTTKTIRLDGAGFLLKTVSFPPICNRSSLGVIAQLDLMAKMANSCRSRFRSA